MQLDEYLKSSVRFHLGFNAGAQIPAGDRARLEEAMALVPDELWYNEIVYHVKRCNMTWAPAFDRNRVSSCYTVTTTPDWS